MIICKLFRYLNCIFAFCEGMKNHFTFVKSVYGGVRTNRL